MKIFLVSKHDYCMSLLKIDMFPFSSTPNFLHFDRCQNCLSFSLLLCMFACSIYVESSFIGVTDLVKA